MAAAKVYNRNRRQQICMRERLTFGMPDGWPSAELALAVWEDLRCCLTGQSCRSH